MPPRDSETPVDLLARIRELGWSPSRVTALRNTCAAAAAKATLPDTERDLARAVADALAGRAPGISASHMAFLERTGLLS